MAHHDTSIQTNGKPKVFLCAGGTGGHLFPAEALGEELIVRGLNIGLITDRRGARFKGNIMRKIMVYQIDSATFKPGAWNKIKAVFHLSRGIIESFLLMKKHKPALVIGFGGYPSLPPVWVAQKLGVPTVLHDSNGVLGKANKFLATRASLIATSFAQTEGVRTQDTHKITITGNPVRPAIIHKRFDDYQKPAIDGVFRLFVTGGSQGAKIFSEVIPAALGLLPENLKKRISLVFQCRRDDIHATREALHKSGVQAEIADFFYNIEEQISKAHLLICRAGASTVSDVTTIGRPAIYVPLWHEDRQQFINANAVVDQGGGWVMVPDGFTPEALATRLETLMRVPDTLTETAAKAKACGRPDATKKLADAVMNLLNGAQAARAPEQENRKAA